MVKISKKIKMIKDIKNFIRDNKLDGYLISKNDTYFTEYSNINNLDKVTNFSGSAGFSLILKNINYLFVDGRYTLQAKKQSGKKFKILEIPYIWPKDLPNLENLKIGFDPKLFTEKTLDKYFEGKVNLIPRQFNFKNNIKNISKKIFILSNSITGESSNSKITKIKNYLIKNKIDYLYSSAGENVNWLLNIRGEDLPNSPLVNCKLIISKEGKLYLFICKNKISNFVKKKLKNVTICK